MKVNVGDGDLELAWLDLIIAPHGQRLKETSWLKSLRPLFAGFEIQELRKLDLAVFVLGFISSRHWLALDAPCLISVVGQRKISCKHWSYEFLGWHNFSHRLVVFAAVYLLVFQCSFFLDKVTNLKLRLFLLFQFNQFLEDVLLLGRLLGHLIISAFHADLVVWILNAGVEVAGAWGLAWLVILGLGGVELLQDQNYFPHVVVEVCFSLYQKTTYYIILKNYLHSGPPKGWQGNQRS